VFSVLRKTTIRTRLVLLIILMVASLSVLSTVFIHELTDFDAGAAQELAAVSEEQAAASEEIAAAVQGVSSRMEKVSSVVENILRQTQDVAKASENVAGGAEGLASYAETMHEELRRFRVEKTGHGVTGGLQALPATS